MQLENKGLISVEKLTQVELSPLHTLQSSITELPPHTPAQSSTADPPQPPSICSPESEQLQNTSNIKLRMKEKRIFTGDILMNYTLGKQV